MQAKPHRLTFVKRERLIRLFLLAEIIYAAAGDAAPKARPVISPTGQATPVQTDCAVKQHGTRVELQSPAFTFVLDTSEGLRIRAWKNRLTGREVSLGLGPEVELDFDAAEQRIWITGWKAQDDQRITHVFLPREAKDKKLVLTLGGFGLYDYRLLVVTINGQQVGVRQENGRWHEPGVFDLSPGSAAYSFLRFGQDNILAIRCKDPVLRTKRMD